MRAFDSNPHDVPFAAVYQRHETAPHLRVIASSGFASVSEAEARRRGITGVVEAALSAMGAGSR